MPGDIKVAIDFSGGKMDRHGRGFFRMIVVVAEVDETAFLELDEIHPGLETDCLAFQAPSVRVLGGFNTGSGLAHPVRHEEGEFPAAGITCQDHMLSFVQVDAGDVFVATKTVPEFDGPLRGLGRGIGLVGGGSIGWVVVAVEKLPGHILQKFAPESGQVLLLHVLLQFPAAFVREEGEVGLEGLRILGRSGWERPEGQENRKE